jgi:hypothetical protein
LGPQNGAGGTHVEEQIIIEFEIGHKNEVTIVAMATMVIQYGQ